VTTDSKSKKMTNIQPKELETVPMPSYTGIVHYVFWYQLLQTIEPMQIGKTKVPFNNGRIWC
jgi:hypothetical protein